MHKLVILIENMENPADFEKNWPQFLHWAEKIPGLRRESTSRVSRSLYGRFSCLLMHELYFDSLEAAQNAMISPAGTQAGRTLQRISGGRVILFLADHLEDTLEHIQASQSQEPENISGAQPPDEDHACADHN